jgi:hypothetical protein
VIACCRFPLLMGVALTVMLASSCFSPLPVLAETTRIAV